MWSWSALGLDHLGPSCVHSTLYFIFPALTYMHRQDGVQTCLNVPPSRGYLFTERPWKELCNWTGTSVSTPSGMLVCILLTAGKHLKTQKWAFLISKWQHGAILNLLMHERHSLPFSASFLPPLLETLPLPQRNTVFYWRLYSNCHLQHCLCGEVITRLCRTLLHVDFFFFFFKKCVTTTFHKLWYLFCKQREGPS